MKACKSIAFLTWRENNRYGDMPSLLTPLVDFYAGSPCTVHHAYCSSRRSLAVSREAPSEAMGTNLSFDCSQGRINFCLHFPVIFQNIWISRGNCLCQLRTLWLSARVRLHWGWRRSKAQRACLCILDGSRQVDETNTLRVILIENRCGHYRLAGQWIGIIVGQNIRSLQRRRMILCSSSSFPAVPTQKKRRMRGR
jgi:hypothetical protein